MSLISHFADESLTEFLRRSNYWASKNRNAYPVKIHKAISELYDVIDCPCDNDCECKKYGCSTHLVRKPGITFDDYYDYFLKCYVDSKAHAALYQGVKDGRGKNSVPATDEIRNNWSAISNVRSKKHLLCSNWCEQLHREMAQFRPNSNTIYRAKWLSLLCFDSFTAYDYASVGLMRRDFNRPSTYLELMKRIRKDIMIHLDNTGGTLQDFRNYDNPSEFFREVPSDSPKPIGNIIDKIYLTL
ncbi:MAG: hypothetical protein HF981_19555 [Desulfobacteraceae bacterium]|nr:hypothetical protein [Desulfobacteraceae bacterium]MBC2752598.1 hypothetical protein [Desulfobacteraceae bacterium]